MLLLSFRKSRGQPPGPLRFVEINVVLHNHGSVPQTIENGERVAQLLITPVFQPAYEIAEALTDTARNARGFGSTGK